MKRPKISEERLINDSMLNSRLIATMLSVSDFVSDKMFKYRFEFIEV